MLFVVVYRSDKTFTPPSDIITTHDGATFIRPTDTLYSAHKKGRFRGLKMINVYFALFSRFSTCGRPVAEEAVNRPAFA